MYDRFWTSIYVSSVSERLSGRDEISRVVSEWKNASRAVNDFESKRDRELESESHMVIQAEKYPLVSAPSSKKAVE